jgi:acetolactate decarboxylase
MGSYISFSAWLLTGLAFSACQPAVETSATTEAPASASRAQPPVVQHYGAMRNFMMQGDLAGKVQLDTLARTHLYGLGVAEGLKGEYLLWDGRAARTRVAPTTGTTTDTAWTGRAALLVTSRVSRWQPAEPVPAAVTDLPALEQFIVERAARQGLDTSQAFVFRLEGKPEQVQWHVMEWPGGAAKQHTMQNHKQYAATGQLNQRAVELLGFFSRNHHGVFIHHTSLMHLHGRPMGEAFAAHVDDVRWLPGQLALQLPAVR